MWQRTPGDPLSTDPSGPAGLDAQTTCSPPGCSTRPDGIRSTRRAGVDRSGRLPARDHQPSRGSYCPGATSAVSRRAPTTWGVLGQFGLPPGSAAGSGHRLGLLPLEPGKLTGGQVGPAIPAPACGRERDGARARPANPSALPTPISTAATAFRSHATGWRSSCTWLARPLSDLAGSSVHSHDRCPARVRDLPPPQARSVHAPCGRGTSGKAV